MRTVTPSPNEDRPRQPVWWTVEYTVIWEAAEPSLRADFERRKAARNRAKLARQGPDDVVLQRTEDVPRNVDVEHAHRVPDQNWEVGEDDWDEVRTAMRYGVGARKQYPDAAGWNDELEARLKEDWEKTYEPSAWQKLKRFVRHGFEFRHRSN